MEKPQALKQRLVLIRTRRRKRSRIRTFWQRKLQAVTTQRIIKFLISHVIALMGDGCFQEGVAREAISFAGHNKLDNLILNL
ncbi:MAG: hypothetical protein ACJZ9L_03165 [Coraliomargaritaceae bacterium]